MDAAWAWYALGAGALAYAAPRVAARLRLSRAKHPSLTGHSRMSKRLARLVPFYSYDEREFFASDGAPAAVAEQRRAGFARLAQHVRERSPLTLALGERLEGSVSDAHFTNAYRV